MGLSLDFILTKRNFRGREGVNHSQNVLLQMKCLNVLLIYRVSCNIMPPMRLEKACNGPCQM